MRYSNIGTDPATGRSLDLLIENTTEYSVAQDGRSIHSKNGWGDGAGNVVQINQQANTATTFQFTVQNTETHEPVELAAFYFSVLDFDFDADTNIGETVCINKDQLSTPQVHIPGYNGIGAVPALDVVEHAANCDGSAGFGSVVISAAAPGFSCDNPTDAQDLTTMPSCEECYNLLYPAPTLTKPEFCSANAASFPINQSARLIELAFADRSSFSLTFSTPTGSGNNGATGSNGAAGRDLQFAGWVSAQADLTECSTSTTTTLTTTTTATTFTTITSTTITTTTMPPSELVGTVPAGYYTAGGAFEGVPCPAGWQCPSVDGSKNEVCQPGSYSTGALAKCTRCPAGFKCANIDAGLSVPCSLGSFSASGATECTPCPSGHSCPKTTGNGAVAQCLPGMTSLAGDWRCHACQAGYACFGGRTTSKCRDGYYSTEGQVQCTLCPAGSFCNDAMSHPELCSDGFFSLAGARSCEPCFENHYCLRNETANPVPCPKGSFSNAGRTNCITCGPGYKCDVTGSPGVSPAEDIITECPRGAYCPNGDAAVLCPSTTHQPLQSQVRMPPPLVSPIVSRAGCFEMQGWGMHSNTRLFLVPFLTETFDQTTMVDRRLHTAAYGCIRLIEYHRIVPPVPRRPRVPRRDWVAIRRNTLPGWPLLHRRTCG